MRARGGAADNRALAGGTEGSNPAPSTDPPI